jgi:CheY-like chemotaxis protein
MAGKKILVVDDEPEFVNMIKMRLEANGYEVIPAYSGKEALDTLKQAKPDVVLLDIMMPELDGLQVLRTIRLKDKKIPIFILTAFSNDERFKLAKQLNASGFMVKTGSLQDEVDNINDALRIADKYKGA